MINLVSIAYVVIRGDLRANYETSNVISAYHYLNKSKIVRNNFSVTKKNLNALSMK